jgi:prolyl-tRNA synthetase
MKQSQLFAKTIKDVPKDEISLNAQLLIRGGYVDKLMAGVYTLLPLGYRVFKKIEQIIREEMNAVDAQEMFMPTLQLKESWQATGRWENLDVLIKLGLTAEDDNNTALAPTHEEVIAPLAKKVVNSYKDLPKAVYQFQNKFRGEKRAKSGVLRGREFIMKDLYSFHEDQADLDFYYEKVKDAYGRIFERAGIGNQTYLTYASGGTFSKYSHEFQTLTSAGEDIIYICDKCKVAVNKEIIEDLEFKCPVCGSQTLHQEKAVEVGNIFKLGTKYSAPFNLTYLDKEGNSQPVIMGCFGIGLQRLMGTIVEVHHDDCGIIWPKEVAPFQVHLISLGQDEQGEKLYLDLQGQGIDVLYDDRDVSAGQKFADADLIGIPLRVVVSKKSLAQGGLEVKYRTQSLIKIMKEGELKNLILGQ